MWPYVKMESPGWALVHCDCVLTGGDGDMDVHRGTAMWGHEEAPSTRQGEGPRGAHPPTAGSGTPACGTGDSVCHPGHPSVDF